MRIVIAGAHGQVARRLGRLLSARGDTVVGIVRNPAHRPTCRTTASSRPSSTSSRRRSTTSPRSSPAPTPWSSPPARPGQRRGPQGHGRPRPRRCCSPTRPSGPASAATCWCRRWAWTRSPTGARPTAWTIRRLPAGEAGGRAGRARPAGSATTVLRPGRLTDEPGTGRVTLGRSRRAGQRAPRRRRGRAAWPCSTPPCDGAVLELVGGATPSTRRSPRLAAERQEPAGPGDQRAGSQLLVGRVVDAHEGEPAGRRHGTSLARSVRASSAAGHSGGRRPSPTASSAPDQAADHRVAERVGRGGDLDQRRRCGRRPGASSVRIVVAPSRRRQKAAKSCSPSSSAAAAPSRRRPASAASRRCRRGAAAAGPPARRSAGRRSAGPGR